MDKGRKENPGCVIVVATAIVVLPAVYVLAIGPAHWLMDHGYLSEVWFDAAYGSLIAVVKKSPAIQDTLVWYIDLWVRS